MEWGMHLLKIIIIIVIIILFTDIHVGSSFTCFIEDIFYLKQFKMLLTFGMTRNYKQKKKF